MAHYVRPCIVPRVSSQLGNFSIENYVLAPKPLRSRNKRVQVSLEPPPTTAVCVCDAGWGGVGCNHQVTQLTLGVPFPALGVPGGDWLYFQYTVLQPGALLAQMRRSSGDPILFLKAQNEGVEVCFPPPLLTRARTPPSGRGPTASGGARRVPAASLAVIS